MNDFLVQFAVQATRILVPIMIILGIVSNSLNIAILSRPNLMHHACSCYFLSLAIVNLFYSSVIMTMNLLGDGYQFDLTLFSSFSCKLISYLLNLCPYLSLYLIVLASIDRYCASSMHARIRRLSSVRVAQWAIGFLFMSIMAIMSWAFAVFDVQYLGLLRCGILSHLLSGQIFLFGLIVCYVIVAPFLMVLFGFLTIKNIHTTRLHLERVSNYRRTESQLSRMLLLQVGVHLLLVLPFCTMFFMIILPIPIRETVEFYYIYVICKLPFYLTFTTAFFLYIISAQAYRNEFLRLFRKLIPIRRIGITNHTVHMNLTIHPTQH